MEFKVGDRVRMIEGGFEGTIEEVVKVDRPHYSYNSGEYSYMYRVANKYKYFHGLDANELELIEASKQPTLENLEQRIEKLEKCVMGEQNSLEKCANVSSMSKSCLLTEDEIVILRNLDKDWKWIARDSDGQLFIFTEKPHKQHDTYWSDKISYMDLCLFNQLFNFIRFGNDEPYNIEELLKGECGNE